jgi:hypothetical protein
MPSNRSKGKSAVAKLNPPASVEASAETVKTELLHSSERKGILVLPTETILEILSYIPRIQLPLLYPSAWTAPEYPNYDPKDEAYGVVRSDVLRSLSQTCRSYRNFFLPLLWEAVCVYSNGGSGVWYKRVSNNLKIISLNLADKKNNSLATYVG